jgi:hypothetical protein
MVLGAPRFGLPGHFDVTGDLCGENIPWVRLYLKVLGVRSTARLTIEDGPMVKNCQKAYSTVRLYMKSYARSPKPPLPELCPRPISRPIVSPDTSRIGSPVGKDDFCKCLLRHSGLVASAHVAARLTHTICQTFCGGWKNSCVD